ncbi:hypothetical protein OVY01_10645 [Robbsia sp. Bb-Pol-6]|uniref:DUF2782 domain-containing protein n=1 Tax=Robbsia betulipollinis TaxID=2981849 RepID=A0ABT3ZMA8_9BURK|nr:hypothetical protein [Robbsia betulipollinis]MCY0387683.1 hypothetical protein [Robbsia betulipollinis]
MKSLAVGFYVGALLFASPVFAQTTDTPDVSQSAPSHAPAAHAMSANEAAGLPDLEAINRPAGTASSKVELNGIRQPSYHTRERDGTEVTEYRDRGKPTEIDVRSNFGTHYQMSTPIDNSPRVPTNGAPNGRVPSIRLTY